jgi:hypothetical protein
MVLGEPGEVGHGEHLNQGGSAPLTSHSSTPTSLPHQVAIETGINRSRLARFGKLVLGMQSMTDFIFLRNRDVPGSPLWPGLPFLLPSRFKRLPHPDKFQFELIASNLADKKVLHQIHTVW